MAGTKPTIARLRDQPGGPSVRKAAVLRTLADPARLTHNEKSLAPAQAPTNENRTLPRRLPNAAYPPREYLTESEVWFLRMVQRTGRAARLTFPVHPHMLRHATGYKLANDGHDTRSLAHYLGHGSLQSTARYTALAPVQAVLERLTLDAPFS
jgi:integrase